MVKLTDSTFQMYVLNHWVVHDHLPIAFWVQVSAVPSHRVQDWQGFVAKAEGTRCESQHISSLPVITSLWTDREGSACAK